MNYLNRSHMGLPRCLQGGSSSGSSTSTPQFTPQQMIEAYGKALPAVLGVTSGLSSPIANDLANAAAGANPTYTQSTLNQINNSGAGYVQAGNRLAQNQAYGQNQLLNGWGGQAANSAVGLNNSLNTVQAGNNGLANQVTSNINLNGLSPGEFNATERANNQGLTATGNLGINNGTNSLANAMNFGGAFNSKLGIAANALNATNNIAQSQNSQVNPYSVATNSGNVSNNFGASQFNPNQANANLTVPYSAASSFGNQLASVSSAAKTTQGNSEGHGGICYLTTVACEYKGLPDDCRELRILRSFRSTIVPKELVDEYKRIAPSIVTKIRGVKEHMDYVWSIVQECIKDIEQGYNADAIAKYRIMTIKLQNI